MASDSNPRSSSSGSRSRRQRQGNTDASLSRESTSPSRSSVRKKGDRRASGRGSSGAPAKNKRKSVGKKAKAQASRSFASPVDSQRKNARDANASKVNSSSSTRAERAESRPSKAVGKRNFFGQPQFEEVEVDIAARKRVGDIRRAERADRAKRARRQYIGYVLRIVIAIVVVLVVIFGSIFVYRSDFLHVENVKVNGVSHLTSSEITDLAAVPDDSTLLRLDTTTITSNLEQSAWVQSVSIHRVFPDTVEINVVEREPGAVVRVSDKAIWVISTDGAWLSAATSDDWDNSMRIVDVSKSLSQPISGSDCNDGGIKNALAIIQGISDDLKSDIKSISAESSIKTSLNLKGGITVAFGDSSDINLKEAAINELLEKYKGKVSYINVRVPSKPTFRTKNSS